MTTVCPEGCRGQSLLRVELESKKLVQKKRVRAMLFAGTPVGAWVALIRSSVGTVPRLCWYDRATNSPDSDCCFCYYTSATTYTATIGTTTTATTTATTTTTTTTTINTSTTTTTTTTIGTTTTTTTATTTTTYYYCHLSLPLFESIFLAIWSKKNFLARDSNK